jgi:tetratricopeptide (TPR) repeat protein
MLMMVDRRTVAGTSFDDRLAVFVDKYRGTEAAALTEFEMLTRRGGMARLDALEAFIRAHPGGLLGARALFAKGLYFSTTVGASGVEPRHANPTDRFMKAVEIVKELQSGRYPASEWVDRAPTLVTSFVWSNPTLSEPNLELVLDVFYALLTGRTDTFAPYPYDGAEHILTQQMADLFERSGAGVAGVERVLDRFEQDTGDRAMADYLRVVLSLSRLNSRGYGYGYNTVHLSDDERTARIERTTGLLDALSRGESHYTRWALATLATFYFEQLDFTRARVRYQEYVARFGTSDYAWLAALRIGECVEGSGDPEGAIDAYRAASTRRDAAAVPMVMGRVAAARVFESQARLDLALAEYRRALASWDNDYGREYMLSLIPAPAGNPADALDRHLSVTQLELQQRVQRLTAAVASPPGALLERGNWLLEQRRWADARTEFERVSSRYPDSAHISAARYGARAARLQQALDRVKSSSPEAALSELQAVTAQPYDAVVTLSRIARASVLRLQGETTTADAMMNEALSQARDEQRTRPAAPAHTALERDVAAIRTLIFKPDGVHPYLIVSSDVNVTLSDGEQRTVSNEQPLPGLDNVLFLNRRETEMLGSISTAFRTAEPNPRQEPMYRLLAWWQTFFAAGPEHWGYLPLETPPFLWRLEFMNAARTRATAHVSTSSFTGHATVLRKLRGVWHVIRTGRDWIS